MESDAYKPPKAESTGQGIVVSIDEFKSLQAKVAAWRDVARSMINSGSLHIDRKDLIDFTKFMNSPSHFPPVYWYDALKRAIAMDKE